LLKNKVEKLFEWCRREMSRARRRSATEGWQARRVARALPNGSRARPRVNGTPASIVRVARGIDAPPRGGRLRVACACCVEVARARPREGGRPRKRGRESGWRAAEGRQITPYNARRRGLPQPSRLAAPLGPSGAAEKHSVLHGGGGVLHMTSGAFWRYMVGFGTGHDLLARCGGSQPLIGLTDVA
jgi:hypothetical protein